MFNGEGSPEPEVVQLHCPRQASGDRTELRGGGYVRLALNWIVPVLILVSVTSCGDNEEDNRDENRPQTFFDACSEPTDCAEPFQCLVTPERTVKVCSLECESIADCPRWVATGHCAGDYQSPCVSGVCSYGCE